MSIRTLSQQKLSTQLYNKTGAKVIIKGSVAFDGSQKTLVNRNSNLAMGTGDFCVELWYKMSSSSGSSFFFSGDNPGGEFAGISLGHTGSSYWYLFGTGSTWTTQRTSGTLTLNAWRHIAVTRSSGTCYFFVNGAQVDTWTDTGNISQPNGSTLWGVGGATGYMTTGSISNLRVVKGNAVYTSGFTVPTQPLVAISGTSLLTCYDPSTISDLSGNATFSSTAGTPSSDSPF